MVLVGRDGRLGLATSPPPSRYAAELFAAAWGPLEVLAAEDPLAGLALEEPPEEDEPEPPDAEPEPDEELAA